ncbi:hypothetical protein Taro_051774 [Colocasia esculenta]|uniref:Uncharacterized protein n=1 Tax=Colocasia esculenta TaxID=4460 RepID=A0A843XGY6_COLES|nr:hypothetical protein [Colocasia esculenta]
MCVVVVAANVSWLCGMYGMDVWLEQVKCRFGPEMKQDLLQFSWSWRPGVALDWLASSFQQVLKGGWTIIECMASLNCARKRCDVVQFSWELVEGSGLRPKNLASTSFVAKLISQDVDGQIPCRRLPVSGSRCCRLLVMNRNN